MTQYAGLCIGGPLDGTLTVAQTTRHYAFERPAAPALSAKRATAMPDIAMKRVSYAFHQIGGVGLWVPEEDGLAVAMNSLATVYVNAVNRG